MHINEYEFDFGKLIDIQEKYEKLIKINISLEELAEEAYRSYLLV